jgi:hypothetical protein
MKTETKLLLQYLFLYPLYYVVAMLGASIILYFLMSWSYVFTFKFFLIMAFIMGGGSYFIHWRIGFYALTEFKKS